MLNITTAFFACDKIKAENIFDQIGISSQRRPETLTLEEYASIADAFYDEKSLRWLLFISKKNRILATILLNI